MGFNMRFLFTIFVLLALVSSAAAVNSGKNRNYYDVTDFGARGDSTTTSGVSIQAAHDKAVARGGGTVKLPAGHYVCSDIDSLLWDIGKVSLIGENSRLDFSAMTAGTAITFTNSSAEGGGDPPNPYYQTGNTIQGITVYGDDRTEATTGIRYEVDSSLHEAAIAHLRVERITVTGFRTAVHFTTNSYLIKHYDCSFFNDSVCISTEGVGDSWNYGENISFVGCTFFNSNLLYRQWDAELNFTNCSFDYPTSGNTFMEINGGFGTFVGCHFEGAAKLMNQIVTYDSWVEFIGCQFLRNVDSAVTVPYITATRNALFVGGQILDIPDTLDVLFRGGDSSKLQVLGTDIRGYTDHGFPDSPYVTTGEIRWHPLDPAPGWPAYDSDSSAFEQIRLTLGGSLWGQDGADPLAAELRYDADSNHWALTDGLRVGGHIKTPGDFYMNTDSNSVQSFLRTFSNASNVGAYLGFDNTDAIKNWTFSHPFGTPNWKVALADGSAGQGLVTDGLGNVAFATVGGSGETNILIDTGTANGTETFSIVQTKVGVELRTRLLREGANVTLSYDTDSSLTIAAGAGAGLDSTEVATIVRDSVANFKSEFEAVLELQGLQGAVIDGQVPNNITIDLATLASTVTIADNESTDEANALVFLPGGDLDGGDLALESDGDLNYNPSTGILSATAFSTTGATDGTITFSGGTSGSAPLGVRAIAGTPARLLLPIADASIVGQTIISDGGTGEDSLSWGWPAVADSASKLDTTWLRSNFTMSLNEITNPTATKSFSMGNNNLVFSFNGPTGADGAFEVEASGGFSGDLMHLHQHTGNPSAVDLLHMEASDADVILMRMSGAADTALVATGSGKFVFDSASVAGRIRVDSLDADKYTDGSIDHGTDITGLTDDDHTQYLKESDTAAFALTILESPIVTTAITVPNNSISPAELDEGGAFTWTSTHDFGAATSVEVPNGTNPTTANAGEIAVDTDDGIEYHDGTAPRMLPNRFTFSKTLALPDSLQAHQDAWTVFVCDSNATPHGITLIALGIKTDNSSTYSVNFEAWDTPNDGSPVTLDLVATSTSYEATETTLTQAAVTAGFTIKANLPTTAGTTELICFGVYRVNTGD